MAKQNVKLTEEEAKEIGVTTEEKVEETKESKERKPLKKWQKILLGVIGGVACGAAGYGIARLTKDDDSDYDDDEVPAIGVEHDHIDFVPADGEPVTIEV